MAIRAATHGFWRGFFSGLVLAAAGLLALAWFHPPVPFLPPEVSPDKLVAPGAPSQPFDPGATQMPGETGLLPAPPAKPLIKGIPTPETAPEVPGAATGSPSLVPATKP